MWNSRGTEEKAKSLNETDLIQFHCFFCLSHIRKTVGDNKPIAVTVELKRHRTDITAELTTTLS